MLPEREHDLLIALKNLVTWEAGMGGFDAPCWPHARALLKRIDPEWAAANDLPICPDCGEPECLGECTDDDEDGSHCPFCDATFPPDTKACSACAGYDGPK